MTSDYERWLIDNVGGYLNMPDWEKKKVREARKLQYGLFNIKKGRWG